MPIGQFVYIFPQNCWPKENLTPRKWFLRIFQRNGLKLDKDLIFSGLVKNVNVYRMAKSKKIWPFRFYAIKF